MSVCLWVSLCGQVTRFSLPPLLLFLLLLLLLLIWSCLSLYERERVRRDRARERGESLWCRMRRRSKVRQSESETKRREGKLLLRNPFLLAVIHAFTGGRITRMADSTGPRITQFFHAFVPCPFLPTEQKEQATQDRDDSHLGSISSSFSFSHRCFPQLRELLFLVFSAFTFSPLSFLQDSVPRRTRTRSGVDSRDREDSTNGK